jgi:hypothetical protein
LTPLHERYNVESATLQVSGLKMEIDKAQFQHLLLALEAPKWTEILTAVIVALSFAIAIGTLLYLRKQIADARDAVLADHTRSKRQMAMEMCAKWSMFTDPETSSVTRLIESLDLAQWMQSQS